MSTLTRDHCPSVVWRFSDACCAYFPTPCSGTGTSQVVAWPRRPWWKPVMRIGEAKNPGPL
eukprot:1015688-Amphidinium_carterae.1